MYCSVAGSFQAIDTLHLFEFIHLAEDFSSQLSQYLGGFHSCRPLSHCIARHAARSEG
jgi:hypothetical protein